MQRVSLRVKNHFFQAFFGRFLVAFSPVLVAFSPQMRPKSPKIGQKTPGKNGL